MAQPFATKEEYRNWVEDQDWYQTIDLKEGLRTKGKFATDRRIPLLDKIDFKGKRVLDVGCNSGQYSLFAKRRGAAEVVGVDVSDLRLQQARILAANEGVDVKVLNRSLFDMEDLGTFDIVMCFAVLTQVSDIFGALQSLKARVGDLCLLETRLASNFWLSLSPLKYIRGVAGVPGFRAVADITVNKHGDFRVAPSLPIVRAALGPDFKVTHKPVTGLRYSWLELRKISRSEQE